MNLKLTLAIIAFLLTATAIYGSETSTGLCLNRWYNKLTQPKTDVDSFFKKEYKSYLGGLVSWEYDTLKTDAFRVSQERNIDTRRTQSNVSQEALNRRKNDSFYKLIANSGVSEQEIEKKLNPTKIQRISNYIVSTIKSDLGFGPKSFNQSTLLGQCSAATRLNAYALSSTVCLKYLLDFILKKTNIDTSSLQGSKQFPGEDTSSWNFRIQATIIAPLLEEAICTFILAPSISSTKGEYAGRTIVPLLFGLAHYHPNSLMWIKLAMLTAPISYFNISYNQNNPENLLVPVLHHAIHNAIACYFLSK